jgi:lysophospholipase L1-like esterase
MQTERQLGESVVFIGEEPAILAHRPVQTHPVSVRNTYLQGEDTIEYLESQDYLLDFDAGTIRRTPNSRLPDFRKNMLYGQEEFNHSDFPGFGNGGYFAFIDYHYARSNTWPIQAGQQRYLTKTVARLEAANPLKIVAFGDSITAGGDATRPDLIYWQRWADDLQRRYPRAGVTIVNGATGGDSTIQGLERLKSKVLDQDPDLVLVAFGMNDHNVNSVTVPEFERNLELLIIRIREGTDAEVVLLSAFPPNPKWKFGTHRMKDYADATRRVAARLSCAYADVYNNWVRLAAEKKPEDLLGNNINHPNDFGHWIYFRVLQAMWDN